MLRVHQSNFRQLGFVEDVPIEALCELGVPVIDDVGSGALGPCSTSPTCAARSRPAPRSCASPATSSSAGRRPGCSSAAPTRSTPPRTHPLARALRIDKLSLAALEATLRLHRDAPEQIPVLAMLGVDARDAQPRARGARGADPGAEVIESHRARRRRSTAAARAPGPGRRPPRRVAVLRAARGDPPLLGRVERDRLLLDPRTLTDEEIAPAAPPRRRCRRARGG